MKIGFVIYDAMTGLDFVGVFDPISRLKTMGFLSDLEWDICGLREEITDGAGLRFRATRVKQSLGGYDAVVVPGGPAAVQLRFDNDFVDWIKTAESCSWKISVCSGALLLGAAGFLRGKKATTHPTRKAELADYCLKVMDQRVVEDGDVITAAGVTAAIDLGLHLCGKWAGLDAREKIRRQMDYAV